MPRCDWEPFYEEFARKLLIYKDNRKDLIDKISVVFRNSGIPGKYYPRVNIDSNRADLGTDLHDIEDIDPFTVLRLFNTRLDKKQDSQYRYIAMYYCSEQIRSVFEINSFFPMTNYDGYGISSIYDNETTFGFGYIIQYQLIPSNVEDAWNLYETILNCANKTEPITPKNLANLLSTFDADHKFLLKDPYRTYQLFWMAPETFVPLSPAVRKFVGNSENGNVFSEKARELLKTLTKRKTEFHWVNYFEFCDEIKKNLKASYRNIGDFVYDAETAYNGGSNIAEMPKEGFTMKPTRSKVISFLNRIGYSEVNKSNLTYSNSLKNNYHEFFVNPELFNDDSFIVLNDDLNNVLSIFKINGKTFDSRQFKLMEGTKNNGKIRFTILNQNDKYIDLRNGIDFTKYLSVFINYDIDSKGSLYSKNVYIVDDKGKVIDQLLTPDYDAYKGGTNHPVGFNKIYYGIPGCGKSHKINHDYNLEDGNKYIRVVFHPDYEYSDFVYQFVPVSDGNGGMSYELHAGPFVEILKKSLEDTKNMYYLVIEEINRGNAASIFGDLFQLLDRDDNGVSCYSIHNSNIKELLRLSTDEIKLPSNLTILATMNTADQNVFTLDTAFKRRWDMEYVFDQFEDSGDNVCPFRNTGIGNTGITWETFHNKINEAISAGESEVISFEDKRLGVWFVNEKDLQDMDRFTNKVIRYLWDDVSKNVQDLFAEGLNYDSIYKERNNSNFLTTIFPNVFSE